MKTTEMFILMVFICSLFSCSSDDKPPTQTTSSDDKPSGIIPEGQLKALEKAKQVEGILQKSDEKRRENMENQGM